MKDNETELGKKEQLEKKKLDKLTLERIANFLQPCNIVKVRKKGLDKVHTPGAQVFIEPHSRFITAFRGPHKRVREELDVPPIPDLEIAYSDYNSVDYMIIGFNIRNGGNYE